MSNKRPKHLRYQSHAHATKHNAHKAMPAEDKPIEELAADERYREAAVRLLQAVFNQPKPKSKPKRKRKP